MRRLRFFDPRYRSFYLSTAAVLIALYTIAPLLWRQALRDYARLERETDAICKCRQ